VDQSIRLTFARTARPAKIEGGQFAEQTKTIGYSFTITIKNTHRFTLPKLLVRDTVPVAGDDKRVRVLLRKPAALADAKEGAFVDASGAQVCWVKNGMKDGKIEWTTKVESGGEVKLELDFDVRGPAEMQWHLKVDS
jgi:hypothetical protein